MTDGCNFPDGFLNKSYFCDDCNKGYVYRYPCKGKRCLACKRLHCPDFIETKRPLAGCQFPTPTSLCRLCHRKFFGVQCYNYHLQRRSLRVKSICESLKRCPDCCYVYELDAKVQRGGNRRAPDHKCDLGECHVCGKKVRRTNITSNVSRKMWTIPK